MAHVTLDHLSQELHPLLALSDAERIAYIRKDRWLDHDRATLLLRRLADLVTYPKCLWMPYLLIWAKSGMGKSMIAETYLRNHPDRDASSLLKHTPVLSIEMPNPAEPKRVYAAILEALGAPSFARGARTDRLIGPRTLDLMDRCGVRTLIIDDFQNLATAQYRIQHTLLTLIRHLSNQLKISVVCLGTEVARNILANNSQMGSRFTGFELKPWNCDQEFNAFMGTLIRTLPLRKPSTLDYKSYDILLARTDGITANIVGLMADLAVAAIRSGQESITAAHIYNSDAIPVRKLAAA